MQNLSVLYKLECFVKISITKKSRISASEKFTIILPLFEIAIQVQTLSSLYFY